MPTFTSSHVVIRTVSSQSAEFGLAGYSVVDVVPDMYFQGELKFSYVATMEFYCIIYIFLI